MFALEMHVYVFQSQIKFKKHNTTNHLSDSRESKNLSKKAVTKSEFVSSPIAQVLPSNGDRPSKASIEWAEWRAE